MKSFKGERISHGYRLPSNSGAASVCVRSKSSSIFGIAIVFSCGAERRFRRFLRANPRPDGAVCLSLLYYGDGRLSIIGYGNGRPRKGRPILFLKQKFSRKMSRKTAHLFGEDAVFLLQDGERGVREPVGVVHAFDRTEGGAAMQAADRGGVGDGENGFAAVGLDDPVERGADPVVEFAHTFALPRTTVHGILPPDSETLGIEPGDVVEVHSLPFARIDLAQGGIGQDGETQGERRRQGGLYRADQIARKDDVGLRQAAVCDVVGADLRLLQPERGKGQFAVSDVDVFQVSFALRVAEQDDGGFHRDSGPFGCSSIPIIPFSTRRRKRENAFLCSFCLFFA